VLHSAFARGLIWKGIHLQVLKSLSLSVLSLLVALILGAIFASSNPELAETFISMRSQEAAAPAETVVSVKSL
jgi:hypothetical protein